MEVSPSVLFLVIAAVLFAVAVFVPAPRGFHIGWAGACFLSLSFLV